MPKKLPPIHPSVRHERVYAKAIRDGILTPLIIAFTERIANAEKSVLGVRMAIAGFPNPDNLDTIAKAMSQEHIVRLNNYHLRRFARTMRMALGVKAKVFGYSARTDAVMAQAIADNVDLIKTIPRRYHKELHDQLMRLAVDAPFDEQAVAKAARRAGDAGSYNVRRIARDQTSKTIGRLTHARQTDAGIERYVWLTAGDIRVRPSHESNNGTTFRWDTPPETGEPGFEIQCRCVGQGVISDELLAKVRNE